MFVPTTERKRRWCSKYLGYFNKRFKKCKKKCKLQKKTEEKTVEIEILNVICANRIAHKRLFIEKTKRDVEKKGAVTQQDSRGNQGNKHQFTKIK